MELNHHRVGSGQPLLLIHGIGSRWQMWEPVIDQLAERHDVIAVDLPGFGASPMPPPGTPPGPESLLELLTRFLAQLGVERPHVAGNSLGGLLALELTRRGQTASATALSPAGFANQVEMAGARGALWVSVRLARVLAPHADRLLASPLGRRLALSLFVAHPQRMPPAAAAADLRAMAAAPWFDATLPTIEAMQAADGEPPPGVPVTIAWGDKDRLLLPRQARSAAHLLPMAQIVRLRGCGHVPTYDDPAQVVRAVLGTIERTGTSPDPTDTSG